MNKLLSIFLFFLFFTGFTTQAQVIQTVAGTGVTGYSGDHGPAISAKLNVPYGVTLDDSGSLFICDAANRCIRKVTPARGGIITTIAGNGTYGYSGDGYLGTYAQLSDPIDVAVDRFGNVYIADAGNNCIRKLTPGDTITTIAGDGIAGYNGDNIPATLAKLNSPTGIAVDSIGNLFIADYFNYRVRKIDTDGIITTVAGTGSRGYSPDGIPASAANLRPYNIRIDRAGNIYISDSARVRKISSGVGGIITSVAGTGVLGYSGDSVMATIAEIDPQAIALDSTGNLFIADGNDRVRKVSITGIINTVAGDGMGGYFGDGGNPLLAKLYGPQGVCVSNSGDIYIGDGGNNCIRIVTSKPLISKNVFIGEYGMNVYPNPCNGNCTIEINTPTKEHINIVIADVIGAQLLKYQFLTNDPFSMHLDLPPGLYFLYATSQKHHFYQKIIME